MNAAELRAEISKCYTMIYFRYCGKEGHVDPYYDARKGYSYLLWYAGKEKLVHSMDEVMNTPFWNGHTLTEIADDLTDIDW